MHREAWELLSIPVIMDNVNYRHLNFFRTKSCWKVTLFVKEVYIFSQAAVTFKKEFESMPNTVQQYGETSAELCLYGVWKASLLTRRIVSEWLGTLFQFLRDSVRSGNSNVHIISDKCKTFSTFQIFQLLYLPASWKVEQKKNMQQFMTLGDDWHQARGSKIFFGV